MTSPDVAAESTVLTSVEEVQSADGPLIDKRWELRPGTIFKYNEATGIGEVILDGDLTPIPIISLVGKLAQNYRVFVQRVPPSGNYVTAVASPGGYAYSTLDTAGVSTSSTTYTTSGITSNGTTFYAPTSGIVEITIRTATANAVGASANTSVRIGEGSTIGGGTVFQAASDNYAVMLSGSASTDMATSFPITGLTPGKQYNVQLQHRTSAGTSFWARRQVMVTPKL